MHSQMVGSYDLSLVALSIVIAMLASYAALGFAGQVTSASGRGRVARLVGGAIVMGMGIWSMHFVGMLAFHLPVSIGYTLPLLVASVVVAVGASLLALLVVSRQTMSIRTLLESGVLMGLAICGMHYIGMASMHVEADLTYDRLRVVLSVVIAIAASVAALWLAFHLRGASTGGDDVSKALAAVVMGIAITGMHYTAMSGAIFSAGSEMASSGARILASQQLGQTIGASALLMTIVAILGSVIDRKVLGERVRMLARLAAQTDELNQKNEELTVQTEELESQTTELALANEDLRLANTRLEQVTQAREMALQMAERAVEGERLANRAREKFTTMISHELRTPIGAIGGYAQLLLLELRGALTDAQRKDLTRISVNQQHVLRLLNELLDLAKLEAGQMPVDLRECQLHEVLEAARPMIEPQLLEKQIVYSGSVDDAIPSVMADPDRVQQIIINLLANSIKFTPDAGSITLSTRRCAGAVQLRVTDSGPGVPLDKRSLMFAPFAQLGATGEHAVGTGLGLALSRELARAMGGELSLESDEGSGATFVLSLTVSAGSQAADLA